MVNYAHARRIRGKQYKRRHRTRRTLVRNAGVNAGIAIRNDNMVWMKRLHRGSAGNKIPRPSTINPVKVLSQYIDNKRTDYGKHKSLRGYSKSKKLKFVKNSFKSEL